MRHSAVTDKFASILVKLGKGLETSLSDCEEK